MATGIPRLSEGIYRSKGSNELGHRLIRKWTAQPMLPLQCSRERKIVERLAAQASSLMNHANDAKPEHNRVRWKKEEVPVFAVARPRESAGTAAPKVIHDRSKCGILRIPRWPERKGIER